MSGHIYVYASELFPSSVRGFSVGLFTIVANVVASFVPYFGLLARRLGVHFLSLFVPLCFCVFLASLPMPETMNRKLQN